MKAITLLLLLCVGCSSAPTRDDATATGARRGAAAEQPAEGVEATPDAETVVPIEEAEVEFASLGDTLRGTVVFPAGEARARGRGLRLQPAPLSHGHGHDTSNVVPSADATSRIRLTSDSTPVSSVWIVSVRPSATRFLPSRHTCPPGCRGWL